MTKKRFTNLYSKPPSTVHPSLNTSGASSSSPNRNDAPPSVNELISSLRKSQISAGERGTSSSKVTPTLPPQIRHLLSLPETTGPKPRARDRRRFDANGRRLPAGPAPPRSWLEKPRSRYALPEAKPCTSNRLFPDDVNHLPELDVLSGRIRTNKKHLGGRNEISLQNMCLRRMAADWEFVREWERHNLADLPTRLRMLLLSNIAVYGPDEGIGVEGLKTVIMLPEVENETAARDPAGNNDNFYRLDLSGSVGRSVSFRQLTELVENPVQQTSSTPATEDSWEDSLLTPLSPKIPYLTHLSLSYPPNSISWPKLLQFAKYIPTLTHLSLAHWPVPSLTPNSNTTVVESKYSEDIQYGGTNYYSHSLDNDFREAASVLRRLASTLYGLEYIDVTGCTKWVRALLWKGDGVLGVEWKTQWLKMRELKVHSGITLSEDSEFWEVARYVIGYKEVSLVRLMMTKERRGIGKGGGWIDLVRDDYREYEGLWKGTRDGEEIRKRIRLDTLNDWKTKERFFHDTVLANEEEVVARSIWDQ